MICLFSLCYEVVHQNTRSTGSSCLAHQSNMSPTAGPIVAARHTTPRNQPVCVDPLFPCRAVSAQSGWFPGCSTLAFWLARRCTLKPAKQSISHVFLFPITETQRATYRADLLSQSTNSHLRGLPPSGARLVVRYVEWVYPVVRDSLSRGSSQHERVYQRNTEHIVADQRRNAS